MLPLTKFIIYHRVDRALLKKNDSIFPNGIINLIIILKLMHLKKSDEFD